MSKAEAAYLKEFTEGLKRLEAKHPYAVLNLDWTILVAVIAAVQLSLRHPRNRGPMSKVVRDFVNNTINAIAAREPRLAELLHLGDDLDEDFSAQDDEKKGDAS